MKRFYVTARSDGIIVNTQEINAKSMTSAKQQITKQLQSEGHTATSKWNTTDGKATRDFSKDADVFEIIISETETQTDKPKPQRKTEFKIKPLISVPFNDYEGIKKLADAQNANRFKYSGYHVGDYVKLFYKTRRARITRILDTPAGIKFLVRYSDKGYTVFNPSDFKRAINAAIMAERNAIRDRQNRRKHAA